MVVRGISSGGAPRASVRSMPCTWVSTSRVATNSSSRIGPKNPGPMVSGGVALIASRAWLNVSLTLSRMVAGVWPWAWVDDVLVDDRGDLGPVRDREVEAGPVHHRLGRGGLGDQAQGQAHEDVEVGGQLQHRPEWLLGIGRLQEGGPLPVLRPKTGQGVLQRWEAFLGQRLDHLVVGAGSRAGHHAPPPGVGRSGLFGTAGWQLADDWIIWCRLAAGDMKPPPGQRGSCDRVLAALLGGRGPPVGGDVAGLVAGQVGRRPRTVGVHQVDLSVG